MFFGGRHRLSGCRAPPLGCAVTKVIGAFDQMDHLRRCVDRRAVVGEPRSGRDVGRHLTRQVELVAERLREQRDDQVLQRDHANAKLHQNGTCAPRPLCLSLPHPSEDTPMLLRQAAVAALAVLANAWYAGAGDVRGGAGKL